jgi:KaiC/GvpD/RAD55 family RecA-like ATPase
LIGFLLKQTRKVGTVLCTLEEHGVTDLTGPETVIPMYLADCVIHLKLDHGSAKHKGELQIIKCRNSRHDAEPHPYEIVRGLGIILQGVDAHRPLTAKAPSQLRQMLLTRGLPKDIRERLEKALEGLTDEDFRSLKPEQVLDLILQEYQAGG